MGKYPIWYSIGFTTATLGSDALWRCTLQRSFGGDCHQFAVSDRLQRGDGHENVDFYRHWRHYQAST